jgi:hypothetical protein
MGHRTPNSHRIAREGVLFTDHYGERGRATGRSWFPPSPKRESQLLSRHGRGLTRPSRAATDGRVKPGHDVLCVPRFNDSGYQFITGRSVDRTGLSKVRIAGRGDRAAGRGPDHRGNVQTIGLRYGAVPQEPSGRSQRIPADGAGYRPAEPFAYKNDRRRRGGGVRRISSTDRDRNFATALAKLDELGLADNRIVVYGTNNGPPACELLAGWRDDLDCPHWWRRPACDVTQRSRWPQPDQSEGRTGPRHFGFRLDQTTGRGTANNANNANNANGALARPGGQT